ncbi:hypothetical protein EVAR_29322_1 [Eumeta japonica]|uniref:Uncharacterized protein n=1 Tax=Eumeta variegata TaxID=151549 RepID=A0A4C1WHM7_EUMVA|nr:hypothetical protein EVAR_29322_1 [Eumeta japonica]
MNKTRLYVKSAARELNLRPRHMSPGFIRSGQTWGFSRDGRDAVGERSAGRGARGAGRRRPMSTADTPRARPGRKVAWRAARRSRPDYLTLLAGPSRTSLLEAITLSDRHSSGPVCDRPDTRRRETSRFEIITMPAPAQVSAADSRLSPLRGTFYFDRRKIYTAVDASCVRSTGAIRYEIHAAANERNGTAEDDAPVETSAGVGGYVAKVPNRRRNRQGTLRSQRRRLFSGMGGNGCQRMAFKSNSKLEHLSAGNIEFITSGVAPPRALSPAASYRRAQLLLWT